MPPVPPVSGGTYASTPPTGTTPPLTPPGPPLNPSGTTYGGRGDAKANLLGYLSLVFGIIGTGCCCCPWINGAPFLGGIPAIVLGFLHLQKVKKGQATMAWLGWVGIILGALAILGAICGLTTDWDSRITDEYDRQFNNP
ncbi:DUF4190 domain-containing protein [Catelliglobosispora koreensis]|uniref:DUF4190 domain-containing protein n=1 Tax=Catelliglobosispora koreensis TaxID=129052 RepID=UPI0012FB9A0C|nr:DUF4190 domain-containing protein [Catelliglobosispora koreensis]